MAESMNGSYSSDKNPKARVPHCGHPFATTVTTEEVRDLVIKEVINKTGVTIYEYQ